MEPPVTPAPALSPEEQAAPPAQNPGPVMDVVAPKPAAPPAPPQSSAEKLAAAAADLPSSTAPKPAAPKAPKKPKSGVGAAISGTVIIILILAGLAVYAYMQTQK